MPRVTVTTDPTEHPMPPLLDENVQSHRLSDERLAMQFIGRLGWAIVDAEDTEAQSGTQRLERPAQRRARVLRSSPPLRAPSRRAC
jgi:hypothetical protein